MTCILRALIAALCFLLPATAFGQGAVLQAGPPAPGRAPMYVNGGSQAVLQDSGPASGGGIGLGLAEQLLTVRGVGNPPFANGGSGPFGSNWCDYDAPTTNLTGFHYLCMSPNAQGGGLLSYGAAGAASQQPFNFIINGATYTFPFAVGGIVGPNTTVTNDVAAWGNTAGTLLSDTGIPYSSLAQGPASAVNGDFPIFNGTSGKLLSDSGIGPANLVARPTGGATAGHVAIFANVLGNQVSDGGPLDFSNVAGTVSTGQLPTIPLSKLPPQPTGTVLGNFSGSSAPPAAVAFNPSGTISVLNIAALRAYPITGLVEGQLIYVQGYYTLNDNGGGFFTFHVGTVSDNGGSQLNSNTTGFSYFRSQTDQPSLLTFGAKGDGTTDNCFAITAINTVTTATAFVTLPPGNYAVNCNITLNGTWVIQPGAILSPGNTFSLTFSHFPVAPAATQIFNLYNASTGIATGGTIVLPGLNGIVDVWGEWFGMVGDATTLHNEVGMQFAINTVHATASSNGGFVRIGTGTFLTCAHYEVTNLVTIKGMGSRSSELLASSSCWTTDTNMVLSVNPAGNHAQFGCWHEDIQINAGAIAAITRVINAGSWQEDSGLKRVLLANFMQIGIIDTDFYGGAASFNLEDVEIFSSASATGTIVGLLMQSPATQDWTNVNLNRVVFATGRATPLGNETGFQFFGRVNVNVTGIHFEQTFVGFDLNDRANLTGSGVNSGNNVTTVVQISAFGNPQNGNEANLPGSSGVTQMSRVALQGLLLGGATTLFHDAVNSVTTTDQFAMPFNYGP